MIGCGQKIVQRRLRKLKKKLSFLRMNRRGLGFIEVIVRSKAVTLLRTGRRLTCDLDSRSLFQLLKSLNAVRLLGGVVYECGSSPSGTGYHIKAVVSKGINVQIARRLVGDDANRIFLDEAFRPPFLRQVLFDCKRRLK